MLCCLISHILIFVDWQTGPISVACSGGQVTCEMLPQVASYRLYQCMDIHVVVIERSTRLHHNVYL